MTKHFTIDNKLYGEANDGISREDDDSGDEVDTKDEKQNHSKGQKRVRQHIIFGGIFAIFWGFVFRERPFCSAGTIKGVGKFTEDKN